MFLISGKTLISTRKHSSWLVSSRTPTKTYKSKIPNDQNSPPSSLPCKILLPAYKKAGPGGGEVVDREDAINISGIARASDMTVIIITALTSTVER